MITDNTKITLTYGQLLRLVEESRVATIAPGYSYDDIIEYEVVPEEEQEYILESAPIGVVKELKRLLYQVLPKKGGKVRFVFKKLDGRIRHAKAEYHRYRPSLRGTPKPPDIITYYDSDKHGYRCFHEVQLLNNYPQWSKN